MPPGARMFCALALAIPIIVLTACQTMKDGAPYSGPYIVTRPTPIYRYGPAQSFGPDFNLAKDQRVTMLKREFGYSRVMTTDGQSGYVATEDVAPAPSEPSPTPTAMPEPTARKAKREQIDRDDIPPPVFDEAPLGLPENPEPSPVPAFRY